MIINDCNVFGNAGVGVRNVAATAVDARQNWWGDAAGPAGALGDGTAGLVVVNPFRTQPVDTGAPPRHDD